jgi:ATP-binding cassette, subfamily B, bacterial MsbA
MDAAKNFSGVDADSSAERPAPSPALAALRPTARRMLGYLRPRAGATLLGLLALFTASAMEPLVPAYFKLLLDHGFKADFVMPLWTLPLAVVALFAIRGVLGFVGNYLFAWSGSHAVLALRADLIASLMRADAGLFSRLSPGVVAARAIHDPQNATTMLIGASTSLLRDGTTLLALLAYLAWLDWRLTLVSLITVPVLAYVVRRIHQRVVKVGGLSYESQVRLLGIVDDIARAWRVVRSFDAGAFERSRFDAEARTLRRVTLKTASASALMTPLTQVVASVGVAIIITLALLDARQGGATAGEFVAFLTALLMTISPLRRLTDVTQPIVGGLILGRACFDLIDTPPEPDLGSRELTDVRGDLRFERLEVTHGGDRPALHGVDLHVPAGTTAALVGPSGSGKSTLVSTLLGFVAPRSGRVLIDGIDITSVRKASLRRQFALVSQDIVLFDSSIDDNVAYSQPPDPARIEQCLRAADLWEFVQSLPQRGSTPIGTNGSRLSGGQRQRLAIARALYRNAKVWLFDEATSALDSESERLVHEAVERWRGERTLVLIAHRLSTVRRADAIHVMAAGRVLDSGPHEALLQRCDLYAAMVRAQSIE